MRKIKLTIERELKTHAEPTVWKLISTAEGLSRWIAEKVIQNDTVLTFTWGKTGQDYETRHADILDVVKHRHIRFRWQDEEDPEAYTEIAMLRLDVTGKLALCITDFSEKEDVVPMTHMWNHDLDRLRGRTGV